MLSFLKKKEIKELKAVLSGNIIPIEQVPEETFASKALGEGIAFEPVNDNIVVAPADGVMTSASETMKHAVGMTLRNDMEVLIHIGIDTVALNGKGYELLVKTGDKVKAGAPLVKFDKEFIESKGYSVITMMIITDSGNVQNFSFTTEKKAVKNKTVVVSLQ